MILIRVTFSNFEVHIIIHSTFFCITEDEVKVEPKLAFVCGQSLTSICLLLQPFRFNLVQQWLCNLSSFLKVNWFLKNSSCPTKWQVNECQRVISTVYVEMWANYIFATFINIRKVSKNGSIVILYYSKKTHCWQRN